MSTNPPRKRPPVAFWVIATILVLPIAVPGLLMLCYWLLGLGTLAYHYIFS